jgi:hypothetical protein
MNSIIKEGTYLHDSLPLTSKAPEPGGPVCGADYAVTGGLVDLRIDDSMDFNAI